MSVSVSFLLGPSESGFTRMRNDGFLHKYFLNNGSKRLHKWVHYFDIYERHFERFRETKPIFLEIGVMGGGSLNMWKEYFGSGSKIIGIDINPRCKIHECDGIEIFIGSQDDEGLLAEVLSKYPHIDIVLDDGSHMSRHMIASFEFLYPRISKSGVYMVEDTHANYWEEWEGGYKKSDTFIEFSKSKIDELNAVHTRGAVPPTTFTKTTDSMAVYDSVIVFEKGVQGSRQDLITNGMMFSSNTIE